MGRKSHCAICALNAEARQIFESKLAMGLPATALADYLITLGVHVTPQQIYAHKKHSKVRGSQIIQRDTSVVPRLTTNVSADGLTTDDRQERLLAIALEAVDSLAAQFNADNNLRVARMLKEMGEWASQLVKDRMAREVQTPQELSYCIQVQSLEPPDWYKEEQPHFETTFQSDRYKELHPTEEQNND
ncbi:MAG: hypothetical protein RMX65_016610 [Nostoc sp. DedQUE01]|nr:hypothetical protein [Nostoc sp. DedQUE01]